MFRAILSILTGLLVLGFSVGVQAAGHSSADRALDDFCIEGQKVITQTSLVARPVIHKTKEDFTASKASIDESGMTIHQFVYVDNVEGHDGPIPKIVSCKFKSADIIKEYFGESAAGEQGTCAAVNQATLDMVAKELEIENPKITVVEDENVFAGTQWISPWPYPVIKVAAEGGLQLQSKGMYIPDVWWLFAVPDRFKGVHYCHLVAPQYLKILLEG